MKKSKFLKKQKQNPIKTNTRNLNMNNLTPIKEIDYLNSIR